MHKFTYFQTLDEYCFLYACIIAKLYKVIILNKKVIFVKIEYNHELYGLSFYISDIDKIGSVKQMKRKIIELIHDCLLPQTGGIGILPNLNTQKRLHHGFDLFVEPRINNYSFEDPE